MTDRKIGPYHQDEIYLAESLEAMARIPDKVVDVVVTDPPYGIGECGKKNHSRDRMARATRYAPKEWDHIRLERAYFDEMRRVSNHQIIFGGNYYTDFLSPSSCWIVWDKDNSGDFADCELIWTSFPTAVRKIKWRWNGMLQEDMRHKETRVHPTQKPVALMRWILERYTKPGDLVLDPFLGSGSTVVACHQTQRAYLGFEKDPDYFRIARARVDETQRQAQIQIPRWT